MLLSPPDNCWRVARADRLAFLVDADAYFGALVQALANARRVVRVLCWDIDSRMDLAQGGRVMPEGLPGRLRDCLDAVGRRGVDVYVLAWDAVFPVDLDREWFPRVKLDWQTSPHVRFREDDQHPVGGSHHQKVVVVDDAVAFVGGIDPAMLRWDTRAHLPRDPRRTIHGEVYPPFHDLMVAVDGEAARALGELARERWRRATGEELPEAGGSASRSAVEALGDDPWPAQVRADLVGVDVGLARTMPAWNDNDEIREIEAFHRDAIRSAKRTIYVENQYLTSSVLRDALAERLGEPDGPEVVIVAPKQCTGFIEQTTMDVLRARWARHLTAADVHGRLRIYAPRVGDGPRDSVMVHAKLMVVDDDILSVGSANLTNRSMFLDTECNLVVDADGDPRLRTAIRRFRDGLVAEHLGLSLSAVARAIDREASVGEAIEHLRHPSGKRLEPLDCEMEDWLEDLVPAADYLDPEGPLQPIRHAVAIVGGGGLVSLGRGVVGAVLARPRDVHEAQRRRTVLGAVGGMIAAWTSLLLGVVALLWRRSAPPSDRATP